MCGLNMGWHSEPVILERAVLLRSGVENLDHDQILIARQLEGVKDSPVVPLDLPRRGVDEVSIGGRRCLMPPSRWAM